MDPSAMNNAPKIDEIIDNEKKINDKIDWLEELSDKWILKAEALILLNKIEPLLKNENSQINDIDLAVDYDTEPASLYIIQDGIVKNEKSYTIGELDNYYNELTSNNLPEAHSNENIENETTETKEKQLILSLKQIDKEIAKLTFKKLDLRKINNKNSREEIQNIDIKRIELGNKWDTIRSELRSLEEKKPEYIEKQLIKSLNKIDKEIARLTFKRLENKKNNNMEKVKEIEKERSKLENKWDNIRGELRSLEEKKENYQNPDLLENKNIWINEDNLPTDENWNTITPDMM